MFVKSKYYEFVNTCFKRLWLVGLISLVLVRVFFICFFDDEVTWLFGNGRRLDETLLTTTFEAGKRAHYDTHQVRAEDAGIQGKTSQLKIGAKTNNP